MKGQDAACDALSTTEATSPAEIAVLQRAVGDMENWISELPASSSWRFAFLAARRELAGCAELRLLSVARTATQESRPH